MAALLSPSGPPQTFPPVSLRGWYLQPFPSSAAPFSRMEDTSTFHEGCGSPPALEPLTFSEGSQRTGIGTQRTLILLKMWCHWGGEAAPPRWHASLSLVECKAGGRGQGPCEGARAVLESGVGAGISQGKPGRGGCGRSSGTGRRARPAQGWRAAPQSRGAKGGGAPAKWPGSAPGLGWARCARGAWVPEPWRLVWSGQCTGRRADALEGEIKLQPPQRR